MTFQMGDKFGLNVLGSYAPRDRISLADALVGRFARSGEPTELVVGRKRGSLPVKRKWKGTFKTYEELDRATVVFGTSFSDGEDIMCYAHYVKLRLYGRRWVDTPLMLKLTEGLPFRYMTCGPVVWWNPREAKAGTRYLGPSFGDGHDFHGWFSAFQGDGHDLLASRRLLRYGPWRLIERPNDLSIVEHHDPYTDPATALVQAKPAHLAIGMSDIGAFIHPSYQFTPTGRGMIDTRSNTFELVLAGEALTAQTCRWLAAIRLYNPFSDKVERTAVVFPDEQEARAALHLAWCWGHTVRTFVDGRERDISADYEPPPPTPPDWVKKRQDEDGF